MTCCGQTPRDITIGLSGGSLVFTYCQRCERKQWYRDSEPVTLTTVKDEAAVEWNKRLVAS